MADLPHPARDRGGQSSNRNVNAGNSQSGKQRRRVNNNGNTRQYNGNSDNENTRYVNIDENTYDRRNLDNSNTSKINAVHRNAANGYNNGYRRQPNNNQNRNAGQRRTQNRPTGYRDNYSYNEVPSKKRQQPERNTGNNNTARRPVRRRRHGGFIRKIVSILIALFVIYSGIVLLCIARMQHVSDGERKRTSGAMSESYVTNVLLIGTDSRDVVSERGRSDSMMLVSINSHTHDIYMTSFLRDSYVNIPGYGSNKLNAAYSYGGGTLLMDTIESNFNIRIDSYIEVSFIGFAKIIDSIGGIKVDVTDAEAEQINIILQSEVNEIMGDNPTDDFLSGGGTYTLDGKQALSYARIRHVGNADFQRTERQRFVMNEIIKKLKTMNPVYLTRIMSTAVPEIYTNMSVASLYLLSLRLPTFLIYSTQQQQIPADGTWSSSTADGQDILDVDFGANEKILQATIFAG